MKQLLCLTLVLGCMTLRGIAAETNALTALTLDQAIALAERQHPELAEANALVSAAEGRAQQAGRFPNPEAVVRMESAPIQRRTFSEAEYPLGLSQNIPLNGRLSKARQVEQLDRQRLAFESEAKRREIRKRVQAAFATALYQERADQTQRELAASATQVAAIIKARLQAGDALPEDVARAEMELARVKVEQQRTGSLRVQAFVALAGAMGESKRRIESVDGALETALEIPALESIAADLERNPAIAASDAEVAVRAARVNLAKAERIPNLNVEALYRRLAGERTHSFDVGLRIPLPLFDHSRGKLRAARAELGAAEARALSTRNQLRARFSEALTTLTTALANARALKIEILPRADTVRKTAEARHAAGDISLGELLPVRRDWAAVQLTYLESLRDAMLAWAEVRNLIR